MRQTRQTRDGSPSTRRFAIDTKIRGAEHRDRLELISHWAVRLDDLCGLLMRHKPDIVHFSGHGTSSGPIVLAGADGTSSRDLGSPSGAGSSNASSGNAATQQEIPPEALVELLHVLRGNVRVVVLNSCYSEAQARAIVEHIDCAVGMSAPIRDEHAIAFAAELYQAISYGKSIQDAFDLGVARLLGEGFSEARGFAKLRTRTGVDPSQIVLVTADTPPSARVESKVEFRTRDEKVKTSMIGEVEDDIRFVLRPLMGDRDQRKARLDRAFAAYPGCWTGSTLMVKRVCSLCSWSSRSASTAKSSLVVLQ